ncbi:MAG TPA: glycine C-acetyltransferase [Exilispira sp.]|nr:glycine C-acetyltransferase [Spirochaetota bacterium]HNV43859.1 glycine C-acetyltransferase [Exilispira sp.]HOV46468.1 glycine C-acetyltransferase [Exilispira sp.]HPO60462.1 glycine C-acetyltransferase [Exilispira sp.]HQM89264.1 glycine C-acetyltransferase [Exilispira sp.]
MDPLHFIDEEISKLKETGLYNTIRTISSSLSSNVVVNGKKVIDMCSNNYLGLANNPVLKEVAKKMIDEYGVGPAAVRSIAGTTDKHLELEKKLAAFKHVESSIHLQSGYCANLGVISSLVGEEDLIFSDELNHASIIDGCRLSKAKIVRYKHTDIEDLENQLKLYKAATCRKLVITDGVFSMDGDIAPLDKITEVAKRYDAIVYVDDAHGEGVLGRNGAGIVDHFKLHNIVDVEVGTLSKAFGIVGGFAAGSGRLVDYLKQKVRPFLFSSAVTLADVGAAIAAVDLLQSSSEPVKNLWDNARYFQNKMKESGFDIGKTQTPITPIMLGDVKLAREFSSKLFENGIFAQAIGYPTVPMGKARIRVMIHAIHTKDDLDYAYNAFCKIGKELKVI